MLSTELKRKTKKENKFDGLNSILNNHFETTCYRLFCCRQLDAQVNNGLYLIRREFDFPSDFTENYSSNASNQYKG
ncbi:hypothetical protein T12_838 [Trichinella patagoniensis]|uniref:Uncharacterized protein n=1 Tax=Trichinella patagoniensis TaxID=990121 RepID=A0A0V0YTE8_9BILA|nr:hypothetical protein T12_838 [Trichinella patagoniensis]